MPVNYELRCRECGKTWGNVPRSFCEDCFSPLEVSYDYDALKKIVRRENLASRAFNMWRYSELLPLTDNFIAPNATGGTPLVASHKLASQWGLKNLYLKNDAVCFPSLSFKDRVVATALTAARRFGLKTVGCSSTWNLPRCSTLRCTARASCASTGTTTTSAACARRLPTAFNGASSTSTCARTIPKGRRPTASKSPSSSVGRTPTTSSSPWRAARSSPRLPKLSRNSSFSAGSSPSP